MMHTHRLSSWQAPAHLAPQPGGSGRFGECIVRNYSLVSWGRTKGKIGFHGGKVAVYRPRVRSYDGHEVTLPTWMAAQAEDWLGRWAMNLMLINVSTRKLRRAVRLPEGKSGWPRGWRLTCPSWTSWSSRSTGCTSATTWYWSLPSALMEKATNIRSRCSKEQPRTL